MQKYWPAFFISLFISKSNKLVSDSNYYCLKWALIKVIIKESLQYTVGKAEPYR